MESNGNEGETDFRALVQKLKVLLENKGSLGDGPTTSGDAEAEVDADASLGYEVTAGAAATTDTEQTEQPEKAAEDYTHWRW